MRGHGAPTRGEALSGSVFVSLIYNAALLLVLAFLYDLIARYFRHHSLAFKLLTGLVLGLISVDVPTTEPHTARRKQPGHDPQQETRDA